MQKNGQVTWKTEWWKLLPLNRIEGKKEWKKFWVGWSTSWNQDCWEKYQQPQLCRWHPLWQKVKRNQTASWCRWKREWKNWLKTQHSKNKDHGIWSNHFMENRWGNSGKQWQTLFSWAPKSLQVVTAAMYSKDACSKIIVCRKSCNQPRKKRKKEKSLNYVRLFAIPWTVAYQAPPSMGFSRKEYLSGLPFPSPTAY